MSRTGSLVPELWCHRHNVDPSGSGPIKRDTVEKKYERTWTTYHRDKGKGSGAVRVGSNQHRRGSPRFPFFPNFVYFSLSMHSALVCGVCDSPLSNSSPPLLDCAHIVLLANTDRLSRSSAGSFRSATLYHLFYHTRLTEVLKIIISRSMALPTVWCCSQRFLSVVNARILDATLEVSLQKKKDIITGLYTPR